MTSEDEVASAASLARRADVAEQLEQLIPALREALLSLTDPDQTAREVYWKVYWLRWQVGRQVARLGAGTPSAHRMKVLSRYYGRSD